MAAMMLAAVIAIPTPASAYDYCHENVEAYSVQVEIIETNPVRRLFNALGDVWAIITPLGAAAACQKADAESGGGGGGGGSGCPAGGEKSAFSQGQETWAKAKLSWSAPPCNGKGYANLGEVHSWSSLPGGWTVSTAHGCLGHQNCYGGSGNTGGGPIYSQTTTKPTSSTWDASARVDL